MRRLLRSTAEHNARTTTLATPVHLQDVTLFAVVIHHIPLIVIKSDMPPTICKDNLVSVAD